MSLLTDNFFPSSSTITTMKKQLILGCLFFSLLGACTSPNMTKETHTIDIAGCFEQLTELKVSQLGKNIRYVPLETTDSSLIGNSHTVRLLKDKILVTTGKRCLLFDKQTGKFLCNVGHQGEDPEGYSETTCYVHPETGVIYFNRQPNKLVKYDQKGNFLGTVILPENLSLGFHTVFSDSLLVAFYSRSFTPSQVENTLLYFNEKGEKKDSITQFANAGQPINMDNIASISVLKDKGGNKVLGLLGYTGIICLELKNEEKAFFPTCYPTLWHSGKDLRFREILGDTIYNIQGNTAQPYLAFNTGDRHLPAEKTGKKNGTEEFLTITYTMETPGNIFFQCVQDIYNKGKVFSGIYNKVDGKTYLNKEEAGITDDLTQFMPFFPETCSEQGEYASLLETGNIGEWLEDHPEISKEGKLEFLKEINEDDNPVCVIVEQ